MVTNGVDNLEGWQNIYQVPEYLQEKKAGMKQCSENNQNALKFAVINGTIHPKMEFKSIHRTG